MTTIVRGLPVWASPQRLIGLGILCGVGGGIVTQLCGEYFRIFTPGNPRATWFYTLGSNVSYWGVWGMLASPILAIAERVRIAGPGARRRRAILFHLVTGLLFVVIHQAICSLCWRGLDALSGIQSAAYSRAVIVNIVRTLDWTLAVYMGLVGLSHALYFQAEAQERALRASQLEASLAEARLEALQRQLHPHFLFNTLHAIFTLVREDPDGAERMIDRLAELLRVTLKHTSAQEVSLDTELRFLQRYLDVQQVLFGDRLRVRIDAPLGLLDATVPYLILQPLVENAIRHGLEPRATPGELTIGARVVEGWLELRVADNGRGLSRHELQQLREGIGLANTRERLARLYPDRSRLEFHDTPGGGLTVLVSLPYVPKEAVA